MEKEIINFITDTILKQRPELEGNLSTDDNIIEDLFLSSFDIFMLKSSIYNQFKIKIDIETIKKYNTISKLSNYLYKKCKKIMIISKKHKKWQNNNIYNT